MKMGEVMEQNLTGMKFWMEFPMINAGYTGLRNKYGYAQLVDSFTSSKAGLPKYGALVKLYFEEQSSVLGCDLIKVEYHKFDDNVFYTGAAFIPKVEGAAENDGWIITFVHDEIQDVASQVYVVNAKDFTSEPVAKITIPCRVPHGFHGVFV